MSEPLSPWFNNNTGIPIPLSSIYNLFSEEQCRRIKWLELLCNIHEYHILNLFNREPVASVEQIGEQLFRTTVSNEGTTERWVSTYPVVHDEEYDESVLKEIQCAKVSSPWRYNPYSE